MKNVAPAQSILEEAGPVEVSPRPELEINEHCQYDENNSKRCVFFFGHAVRKAVRRGGSEQAPGMKVNESRDRVNVRWFSMSCHNRPDGEETGALTRGIDWTFLTQGVLA